MNLESQLPLLPNFLAVSNKLRATDNQRHNGLIKQAVRDGVEINGFLENEYNMPTLRIQIEGKSMRLFIWMFPEVEQFILRYLFSGDNTKFPKYLKDHELPDFLAEDDYIYRHVKREIERNSYTCNEETQDGINGIQFIGLYPYGSINYGFFPYSWDELNIQLQGIEPFIFVHPTYDIPELQNNNLPIEEKILEQDKYLDSVFEDGHIPNNTIIDKTICGCGATWLEINDTTRNSIIIEPNIPVIIGKEQQHKHLIGVYGDKIQAVDIAQKIQDNTGAIKLMTTPDSYPKVINALKSLQINYLNDFFLLFDECEKIVSDIDFRQNMVLPIDDFFKFRYKAMVSATPIVVNDPKFEQQRFKVIKVRPQFDHKKILELKPTNNVNALIKRIVEKVESESTICIFFNSVKGIVELIDILNLGEQASIFCSTDAKKKLKKKEYPRVFDSVTDTDGNTNLGKYNFFTSRFYSAVDIIIDNTPIVIMVTQVYKTVHDETPYSLIDPETEAIQIAGRFRNGISRLIHVTNTTPKLDYYSREDLGQFLKEQHMGMLLMSDLLDSVVEDGARYIISEAISKTEYYTEGYVNHRTKEINYFRYNNAYLDERLKMLYRYPAPLNKAYKRSGAFTVISEAEFAIYSDDERAELNNAASKEKRAEILNDILERYWNSENPSHYDYRLVEELTQEFTLLVVGLLTIGFFRMKELGFRDSAMSAEIVKFRFLKEATNPQVLQEVYSIFQENTIHPTRFIKEQLAIIFKKYNIVLGRQPKGEDITLYFNARERRTRQERGWALADRRYNNL